ncbi:MAG: hypothetical protein EHM72_20895, partial [Calditrichaeota bacterium]
SHHPGRIIAILVDLQSEVSEFHARISAYYHDLQAGQKQIVAEVIVLETGRMGADHLSGAALPLLLPDLPVFFWCTVALTLIHSQVKTLLRYSDRLILNSAEDDYSTRELCKSLDAILQWRRQCHVSDLNWSRLTMWREAIAQLFDKVQYNRFLSLLYEIEISYSDDQLSSQVLLLAGWLSSRLHNVSALPRGSDDTTVFFGHRSKQTAIKIRRKKMQQVDGIYKVKLIAEENEKAVIFTVTARQNGGLESVIQIGSTFYPATFMHSLPMSEAQCLCNELDFMEQDEVYLQACQNVIEYLHEN